MQFQVSVFVLVACAFGVCFEMLSSGHGMTIAISAAGPKGDSQKAVTTNLPSQREGGLTGYMWQLT